MDIVTSRDGTPIAVDLAGAGTPIVFVTGAFNDRATCAPLAAALQDRHTTLTYDRRGRGASGDATAYTVDRELDDLAALIDKAGAPAAVFGFSSGAVLALRAAAAGLPITHLALYEAPIGVEGEPMAPDLPQRLATLIEQGRPDDAVALFQTEGIRLPAALVAQIRTSPAWPALVAMARSTVYDATVVSSTPQADPAMAALATPALVLNGAETWPALRRAAAALAVTLPGGRHVEVAGGANHQIPAAATAAVLREFLAP